MQVPDVGSVPAAACKWFSSSVADTENEHGAKPDYADYASAKLEWCRKFQAKMYLEGCLHSENV